VKPHPAAELFPMMSPLELSVLARSIAEEGLQHPIVTFKGAILDGRNRLAACEMRGVSPRFVEWAGDGSPVAYVLATNLHRRHLDESQRGIIAGKAAKMFVAEARRRQISGVRQVDRWQSRDQAANLLNVSPRTVSHGKRVVDRGVPELVAMVEAQEVAVSAASAIADLSPEQQRALLLLGAPAVVQAAKEQRRPKNNSDELFDEFKRLWKRAGNDVRRRIVEFIEQ